MSRSSRKRSQQHSGHAVSGRELRASFYLPAAIIGAIWLIGVLVFWFLPGSFNTAVFVIIGVGLVALLVYWTRHASAGLRLLAVLFALPALGGITAGLLTGRSRFLLIGVSITFALLILQRFLQTPISYRAAYRRFADGDLEQALDLISRSIASRPDFWESYQLRALLHLTNQHFSHAERDARQALSLNPRAHSAYNTLGQIYLAQCIFDDAAGAFEAAVQLDPDSALYRYYLGLCRYRQQRYRAAAESLALATQKRLVADAYELQAHYYLGRSLEHLGEGDLAREAFKRMGELSASLAGWRQQIDALPDYPHADRLRSDLKDMQEQLSQAQ